MHNKLSRRSSTEPCDRHQAILQRGGFLLLLLSAFLSLGAQEDRPVIDLGEDVVVASPIVEGNRTDPFAGQKTVVSHEQVSGLNAQDLSSALRTTPGVNITRYNVIGSFGGGAGGAVFVRGLGSSRPGGEIQTLIDGVPMFNAIWHHPLLDLNPVGIAETIEVHKGVQPAAFGNAFSAINLKPKRLRSEGFKTDIGAAYGRHDTVIETAEHGGKIGAFDYYAGQSFRRSGGHRQDSDGRLFDGHLGLGYEISESWEARFFLLRTDNDAKDPGPKGQPALKEGTYETSEWLTTLSVGHRHDLLEGEWKAYWSAGAGDWRNQAGNARDTLNDWKLYGVRGKETLHLWNGGHLLLGSDLDYAAGSATFTHDDATPDGRFHNTVFHLASFYAAVSHEFGNKETLSVQPSAGLRYYDHSVFDSAFSPFCGLVVARGKTKLHASLARGVSYPGLNVVVFSENVIPALGDSWEDLDPERVDHFEVGISQSIGDATTVDVTYFHDAGKDRYVIVPPPPPPPSFENIEDFKIRGVEATVTTFPMDDLSLFGGMTYIDPDPGDLPYAPRWTLSSGMNLRFFDHFRLGVDAQYVDRMHVGSQLRSAGAENTGDVGSHCLLNAKLSYTFPVGCAGAACTLFVAGENLTDSDYEYQPGYPMPGASIMTGLNLRF